MEAALAQEVQTNSWYNHYQCLDGAERLAGGTPAPSGGGKAGAAVAAAGPAGGDGDLAQQVASLKKENKELRKVTDDLRTLVQRLESRVSALEKGSSASAPAAQKAAPAAAAAPADDDDDDDDDVDLFGSDDEVDEEAEKLKQQRLKEYNERKAAKNKVVIAKSSIILDIKPWDDETDMKAMEEKVRSIEMDGLLWGTGKLVPVAYNVKKLQIMCVVEDDKVSIEQLQEQIEEFEDYVQSTDIAAFNKI